jgi:quinoprotein glucose dehydrogenase
MRIVRSGIAIVLASWLASSLSAQEVLPDGTDAAKKAISGFRFPEGMKMELFAAEPQLSGPVAICLDEKGRVFVAEEYRFNRGTEENRTRPFLLEDDLQIESLDDRLAMFRKYADQFEGGMDWFSKVSDQVRLLEDTDGDGHADVSKIFAGKFNGVLDGLAAGVIAKDGDVYLTCIPHLWLLRDEDGDGVAEVRKSLLTGFGVNTGFLGHDLHGLAWGPDGRLYFSVGDRGFNVTTKEGKKLVGPRRGAVFRCDPDGANFEVVHLGLRNPQEIAFDEFGNLFAADNNCDKGDLSRLVYIVEGGDSGWNMAYQSIPDPYLTGPWNAEKTWHVSAPDRPAYVTPPVGHLGAGPSGFAYYPGVGLPDRYKGHFFLCNYTGNGGIESFAVKPKGAGFEIIDEHDFLKPIKATDVDFGYDGKMYVSDFVDLDWSGKSLGGRVYTLFHPELTMVGSYASQTASLFRSGFRKLSRDELALNLLDHQDFRVRLRVQFELVRRALDGDKETLQLLGTLAVTDYTTGISQRHAIWALGQIGRKNSEALPLLRRVLTHRFDEARAQAAKTLGDLRDAASEEAFLKLLQEDKSVRVRFFAANALGRIRSKKAVDPLFELLRKNADEDPFLSHAAVVALHSIGDLAPVLVRATSDNKAERLAAILVLRRASSPLLTRFLNDPDLSLVTEVARAINDLPVDSGTAELAATAERVLGEPAAAPDALTRRVINANFRLGGKQNAATLVRLATESRLSTAMRAEALAALSDWAEPGSRDRVNGFWRPLSPREPDVIRSVVQDSAAALLAGTEGELLPTTLKLLAKFQVEINDAEIATWALDGKRPVATRVESLRLLAARKSPETSNVVAQFLKAQQSPLKIAAWEELANTEPPRAAHEIQSSGQAALSVDELQAAMRILASLKDGSGDRLIVEGLKIAASSDDPPPEWKFIRAVELDVIAAAETRNSDTMKPLLAAYRSRLDEAAKTDPLAMFRAAQSGGNVARGEAIFRGHRRAQCLRCHKVNGYGGEAGPDISKVASRGNRKFLLESLIDPHSKIAKGFGTVTFILNDGKVISGTVKSESKTGVVLTLPQGRAVTIKTDDIDERTDPKSPMPGVRDVLSKAELRDLVEFLSTLK